jgi:dienelactone hydrolase
MHRINACAFWLAFVLILGIALTLAAAEPTKLVPPPPAEPTGPMWDLQALSQAPKVYPADDFKAEGVKGLFYEGLPYHGQPTRVFAWLGLPKAAPGQRVPGMVLIHGGGGTAFDAWVRLWNDRGYAAIAMDTSGCLPTSDEHRKHPRHAHGGPAGWGGYAQIDEPRQDQWAYHAVTDAVLAHSLLRAQPEVDPQRIGLTGISWGGYLTCLTASVDSRFRFAVPVYGCGFTDEHSFAKNVLGLGPERADRWMRWWDPSSYLKGATMPMLWVNGSNDFAYTLNAYQKSYRMASGPRTLCIRLRMPHGHSAGQTPKEIFVFAESVLNGGDPLAKITGQGRTDRQAWVVFDSSHRIVKAELNVTKDLGLWPDRKWEVLPAELDKAGRVTATLPAGTTVYYFNLIDDRDCVVSSEHEELPKP